MTYRTRKSEIRSARRHGRMSMVQVLATEAPGLLAFSGGAVALLTVGALIVGSVT